MEWGLLAGLPAGRMLGLLNFHAKRLVQFFVLAPAVVPGFTAAIGIHFAFIRYSLAGTLVPNPWQVFRYVTLHSFLPGIQSACLCAFMIFWGQYLLTLLIGGGRVLTLPT